MTDNDEPNFENAFQEHEALLDNYQEIDFGQQNTGPTTDIDFDAIVADYAGTGFEQVQAVPIAQPDVNVEALMQDTIDKARSTIGLEADEGQFFDTLSQMNTFARISFLVDEIKKDPTEWFLYLYLKHTEYSSFERSDDYAIYLPEIEKKNYSTERQMDIALNKLNDVYKRNPNETNEPLQAVALSSLKNVDTFRVDSTVNQVKKSKVVNCVQTLVSNEIDFDIAQEMKLFSNSGFNLVCSLPTSLDFYLKLDDQFLIGNNTDSHYGLNLTSLDGSSNFGSSHLSTVYLRSAILKNDAKNYKMDVKTIRPFRAKERFFFGMDIFERGGFRMLKGLLNRLKIPYFLKFRPHNNVHFVAIPACRESNLVNNVFYRNYYNSIKNQKVPFNAYNLVKYVQSIPNADLMNFQHGKNINGTRPCDSYSHRYYSSTSKRFITPAYFPNFKPSNGRCMNSLECNCFVAYPPDVTAFKDLYIGFDGDRQIPFGIKNICSFCGTSYSGNQCTNVQHKTRVAARLKHLQTKFKNVEENLTDPCSNCALILRRINHETSGFITMEEANFVNYESDNPNATMLSSILYHYGGKTVVVDQETEILIEPFLKEVACDLKVVEMQDRDQYSKYICSHPICGRIREWKKLSCITDIILSTQLKLQDSNEKSNDPDALLEALGVVDEATRKVKANTQEYLNHLDGEVKRIAKRIGTGDGNPGMQQKRVKQTVRKMRMKKN